MNEYPTFICDIQMEQMSLNVDDWKRDRYWMVAINNRIAEGDSLLLRSVHSQINMHDIPRSCIVYLSKSYETAKVTMYCHRYKEYTAKIPYREEYESRPYIVEGYGSNGSNWYMSGGIATDSEIVTLPMHHDVSDKYVRISGSTKDEFCNFGKTYQTPQIITTLNAPKAPSLIDTALIPSDEALADPVRQPKRINPPKVSFNITKDIGKVTIL